MRCENLVRLLCLTGALGLAACGSKVRYPSYYVLNIPPPAPELVQMKSTLAPGMAQAAEQTVAYLVSSLHDRVLQEAFTST
jgi:hypothetical protein